MPGDSSENLGVLLLRIPAGTPLTAKVNSSCAWVIPQLSTYMGVLSPQWVGIPKTQAREAG